MGGARLQDRHPRRARSLAYRTSTGAALRWRSVNLNVEFCPWRRIHEFIVEGDALHPGDWIEVVFGDRAWGSPGVEIRPMDESALEQRIYVDAQGAGDFLPLAESLGLLFSRAGPGTHRACGDGLGNPTTGYRGTVSLNRGSLPRVRRGSADGRRCCGFRTPDVVGLGGGNRRIRMIRIVTNGAILCALDPPSEETAFECSIRTALRMVRANAWISSRTIAKQPSPVRSG